MAASLRAAATRMMRPAVHPGEGLGRIFRTQKLSKSTRAYEKDSPALKEFRASRIRLKKEWLYDLIAGADANSDTFLMNRSLLKDLSTQVKPRPQDPQWRKITRRKSLAKWTAAVVIVTSCWFSYGELSYGEHGRVAAAGGVSKQYEHRRVATAEGVSKHYGYQPVATAEGVSKHYGYKPVATAEGVHKQAGSWPVSTSEGVHEQGGYQPAPSAKGL